MIRFATPYDNDKIADLLIDFYKEYKHPLAMDKNNWSRTHLDKVLTQLYSGMGFVLIDEKGTGFLAALRTPCIWIPNVYQLQEAMWHGKSKKVKLELLKKYLEIGRQWKQEGKITECYFNNYSNADFGRYNLKQIGNIWSI